MFVTKLDHFIHYDNSREINKKPSIFKRLEMIAISPSYEGNRISLFTTVFKWGVFLGDFSVQGHNTSPVMARTLGKMSEYSNVISFWNIPNNLLSLVLKIKNTFSCRVFTSNSENLTNKDYFQAVATVSDAGSSAVGVISGTVFRSPLHLELIFHGDKLADIQNSFERSICSHVGNSLKAVSLVSKIMIGGERRLIYIIDLIFLIAKVALVVLMMTSLTINAAVPLSLASITLLWSLYKVWQST